MKLSDWVREARAVRGSPLRTYKLKPWPRYHILHLMQAFQQKFGYHLYDSTAQTVGVQDKDLKAAKQFINHWIGKQKGMGGGLKKYTLTKAAKGCTEGACQACKGCLQGGEKWVCSKCRDEIKGYLGEDYIDPNGPQWYSKVMRRLPLVRHNPYSW